MFPASSKIGALSRKGIIPSPRCRPWQNELVSHDHSHHGHHHHAPASFGRALAIGISLNLAFVLVEAFFGWRAGSLALLADAGHNLSDVGGLVLAWAGLAAARLQGNDRHTYGFRRGSILASFGNAVLLLVAMGSLAWKRRSACRIRRRSPAAR